MKRVIYAVVALGAVGTLAMMAYAGQSFASLLSGFTLWALAPFATFAVACAVARNRGVVIAALLAVVVAVVFAAFIYTEAFFIQIHSKSALVFIFVPLYQLIVAIALLVTAVIARCVRSTQTI